MNWKKFNYLIEFQVFLLVKYFKIWAIGESMIVWYHKEYHIFKLLDQSNYLKI